MKEDWDVTYKKVGIISSINCYPYIKESVWIETVDLLLNGIERLVLSELARVVEEDIIWKVFHEGRLE